VYRLGHEGKVQLQYRLSEGVKCIVSDGSWMYMGYNDGNVYGLSGKTPRLAYEINTCIDIYWLGIANGLLAVSDAAGLLTTATMINRRQDSHLYACLTHCFTIKYIELMTLRLVCLSSIKLYFFISLCNRKN
jgi:outer membrane protein assembly factor BamB